MIKDADLDAWLSAKDQETYRRTRPWRPRVRLLVRAYWRDVLLIAVLLIAVARIVLDAFSVQLGGL